MALETANLGVDRDGGRGRQRAGTYAIAGGITIPSWSGHSMSAGLYLLRYSSHADVPDWLDRSEARRLEGLCRWPGWRSNPEVAIPHPRPYLEQSHNSPSHQVVRRGLAGRAERYNVDIGRGSISSFRDNQMGVEVLCRKELLNEGLPRLRRIRLIPRLNSSRKHDLRVRRQLLV